MTEDDLNRITKSITDKIGEELSGVISDDIGELLTLNKTAIDKTTALENDIVNLKTRNEQLISANSNLLKQVPFKEDPQAKIVDKKEEKKSFSFMAQFDKNGNFIS